MDTEGIFRQCCSATALQELRKALDQGVDVDMGSQPALLLAILLKDFLRSIPSKLLVTELYEDWVAAMQMASREQKISELKGVAKKLPAANLLLLQQLLSLLQHIGQHVSTSRMSSRTLAICLGPTLLSPPQEDLLPLEAVLAAIEQVKVLVEFLVENCDAIFGEETAGPGESPAPTDTCTELHLEEQSGPAGAADEDQQAKTCLDASSSLPHLLEEDGADPVVETQRAEALPALPPNIPQCATESLAPTEPLRSLSESKRFADCSQEKRRKRRREEAWPEEMDCQGERKRRKTAGRHLKKSRKVRQIQRPRCCFPVGR